MLPDVEFDEGAAADAAEACREMAARLDGLLDARARGGADAGTDWAGSSRREFDSIGSALRAEGGALREQLLRSAGAIEDVMADAAAEQRRRDDENERRREENEEERARLAEERAGAGGPR